MSALIFNTCAGLAARGNISVLGKNKRVVLLNQSNLAIKNLLRKVLHLKVDFTKFKGGRFVAYSNKRFNTDAANRGGKPTALAV